MSLAIVRKSPLNNRLKKNRHAVNAAFKNSHTIHPNPQVPIIQLKPICPCDGGCPSCVGIIQPKLTIGQPNDKYEQEADRIAEQVMRIPEPQCPECEKERTVQPPLVSSQITPLVQRQPGQEEEKEEGAIEAKLAVGGPVQRQEQDPEDQEEAIQTKLTEDSILQRQKEEPEEEEEEEEEGGEPIQTKQVISHTPLVTPNLESKIRFLKGSGHLLPHPTRAFFEARFGYDFSGVCIHTDARTAQAARLINARAFTAGCNILFGAGQYNPVAVEGKKLLAHELTHVVQQNKGHSKPQNVVQCWSPSVHKDLTKKGILSHIKGPNVTRLLWGLPSVSNDMDFRIPELWFNLGGKLIGMKEWTEPLSAKVRRLITGRSLNQEKHRDLRKHYKANEVRARNHGEGGLYCMTESKAAAINETHQKQYEELFKRGRRIRALGDALHVAQDRGAHGEGAINKGHDREIDTGISPDDPKENTTGYEKSQENTALLLGRLKGILERPIPPRKAHPLAYPEIKYRGPGIY